MFHMEKRSRNTLIIIIIVIVKPKVTVSYSLRKSTISESVGYFFPHLYSILLYYKSVN